MGVWFQLKPDNEDKKKLSLKFLRSRRFSLTVDEEKNHIYVMFSKKHLSLVFAMREKYGCQVTRCENPPHLINDIRKENNMSDVSDTLTESRAFQAEERFHMPAEENISEATSPGENDGHDEENTGESAAYEGASGDTPVGSAATLMVADTQAKEEEKKIEYNLKKLDSVTLKELARDFSAKEIAALYDVPPATFYRHVKNLALEEPIFYIYRCELCGLKFEGQHGKGKYNGHCNSPEHKRKQREAGSQRAPEEKPLLTQDQDTGDEQFNDKKAGVKMLIAGVLKGYSKRIAAFERERDKFALQLANCELQLQAVQKEKEAFVRDIQQSLSLRISS